MPCSFTAWGIFTNFFLTTPARPPANCALPSPAAAATRKTPYPCAACPGTPWKAMWPSSSARATRLPSATRPKTPRPPRAWSNAPSPELSRRARYWRTPTSRPRATTIWARSMPPRRTRAAPLPGRTSPPASGPAWNLSAPPSSGSGCKSWLPANCSRPKGWNRHPARCWTACAWCACRVRSSTCSAPRSAC